MPEAVPILRILICLVSGLLILTCPFLRRSPVFLLLSLLSMVLAYRQLAFAYALTSGAVFFFTTWIWVRTKERLTSLTWHHTCAIAGRGISHGDEADVRGH